MGIVNFAVGEARLQNEIASAVAGRTTLSIIRVISSLDDTLVGADRSRASRGVARAIESSIGAHDVAYSNGPNDFVVVLPDSDAAAAADVTSRITVAANLATILTGRDRRRRRFSDFGTVQVSPSTIAGRLTA
jgi:GGDEF domain-containing protein